MLTNADHLPSRLIAKVLREVLAAESFASLADLIDALTTRLAQYRLRWTPEDLTAALELVGSNRRLLTGAPLSPPPRERLDASRAPVITRQQAPAVLARLLRGQPSPVRSMPAAAVVAVTAADRVRTLTQLLDDLLALKEDSHS
jgi:hypothetical protein